MSGQSPALYDGVVVKHVSYGTDHTSLDVAIYTHGSQIMRFHINVHVVQTKLSLGDKRMFFIDYQYAIDMGKLTSPCLLVRAICVPVVKHVDLRISSPLPLLL